MEKKKRRRSAMYINLLLLLALFILPLTATATTISINDVFMKPGDNAVVPVMINNVSYVGVADIDITYDPSVVHITAVNNSDFDNLYSVIDNSSGLVRIGVVDYGDGLSGNVKLADVTLKAVGIDDETSTLALSINELKEAGAIETPIPATVDNGTVILNLKPVAIPISVHCYNNIGSSYPCNVTLKGTASYDPDGDNILTYEWNFGDGDFGSGETVKHVYRNCKWNGTGYEPFNVSLTVKDDGGLANTTIVQVNVYIAGDANGDGRVNILDAVIVGREWGEKCMAEDCYWEGHERADRADLNNDCHVNLLDAVIIGANWGDVAW